MQIEPWRYTVPLSDLSRCRLEWKKDLADASRIQVRGDPCDWTKSMFGGLEIVRQALNALDNVHIILI